MKRSTIAISNVGSVCKDIRYQELSNIVAKRVDCWIYFIKLLALFTLF